MNYKPEYHNPHKSRNISIVWQVIDEAVMTWHGDYGYTKLEFYSFCDMSWARV